MVTLLKIALPSSASATIVSNLAMSLRLARHLLLLLRSNVTYVWVLVIFGQNAPMRGFSATYVYR
jgi:hypothetical protein